MQDNILMVHPSYCETFFESLGDKVFLKKQLYVSDSLNISMAIPQVFNISENNMSYYV